VTRVDVATGIWLLIGNGEPPSVTFFIQRPDGEVAGATLPRDELKRLVERLQETLVEKPLFAGTPDPASIDAPGGRHEQITRLWNQLQRDPIPKVVRIGKSLRGHVEARWREWPKIEYWDRAIRALMASEWCRGEQADGRGWVADFTYLVKSEATFARWVQRGLAGEGVPARVRNCTHEPPCRAEGGRSAEAVCTEKRLRGQ